MLGIKWAMFSLLTLVFASTEHAHSLSDGIETLNTKILYISNSERGQANVFFATSQSLLDNYPFVEIHWASFPPLSTALTAFSQSAGSPDRLIAFHPLNGTAYVEKLALVGFEIRDLPHPPGFRGAAQALSNTPILYVPWNGSEYVEIYKDIIKVIEDVNPGLVVVDSMFTPAHDAVRQLQQEHVLLSPNSLRDFSAARQPRGELFWKFPIMGSAFPFPLPWYLIPSNLAVWARLLVILFSSSLFGHLHELTTYRQSHGVDNPVNPHTSLTQESTLLVASAPELEYPMLIPPNLIPCGPIVLDSPPRSDLDPGFLSWVESAPTVLINLGSHLTYDEKRAVEFALFIDLLLSRSDVQVLWKFNKDNADNYSDDFLSTISPYIQSTRLRIISWVPGNLGTLSKTAQIVCLVHHGGASTFHEAIASGVPQVVLPLWWDTYEYANQVQWLGVGVWGNRKYAPNVHADELASAVFQVLDGSSFEKKAREVAGWFKERPGRDIAAEKIVERLLSRNPAYPSTDGTVMRDEL